MNLFQAPIHFGVIIPLHAPFNFATSSGAEMRNLFVGHRIFAVIAPSIPMRLANAELKVL